MDIETIKTQYQQGKISLDEWANNQDMGAVYGFMEDSPAIKEYVDSLLR